MRKKITFFVLLTMIFVSFLYVKNAKAEEVNIIITSPAGGETFEVGQKISIKWNQTNIDYLSISYYYNASEQKVGGTIFTNYKVDTTSTDGIYDWTIPTNLPTRSDYVISITGSRLNAGSKTVETGVFKIIGTEMFSNIISNVKITGFSKSEAIVEWDTSIADKSTIYWTGISNCTSLWDLTSGDKVIDSVSKTKHKVYLGYSTLEKICYRIKDSNGNKTEFMQFVNPIKTPYTDNLNISNIKFTPAVNSVKINWTTDKPASSAAYVKPASDYQQYFYDSNIFTINNNLTTTHELIINNLNKETAYKVRVESKTNDNKIASNLFDGIDVNAFTTLYSDNFADLIIKNVTIEKRGNDSDYYLYITIQNIAGQSASEKQEAVVDISDLDTGATYHADKIDYIIPGYQAELKTYRPVDLKVSKIYKIKAKINSSNEIKEPNIDNNTFEKTIAVSGDQPKVCTVCVGGADTGKIDSNGCPIYSCPTPTCSMPVCKDSSNPYYTGKIDANGCKLYLCQEISSSLISEKVKCWFKGSQTEQKCYMAGYNDIGCSGKESCIMDVIRTKGEKITWKSSCGGYAYTTMDGTGGYDGRGEYAEFDCAIAATSSGVSTVPAATAVPTITAVPGATENKVEIIDMKYKAKDMFDDKYDSILAELKQLRDTVKEQQTEIKYLKSMTNDLRNVSEAMKSAINDFITYGVDANTVKLGAGERAAVINSYKAAFAKLPETEAELTDAIKIANGRFPSLVSDKAETAAKEQFIKIYKRVPDLNDAQDNAAIKVMAYGLRQKAANRNLNSEKFGIKTFKAIYGWTPKTTQDWNTMQAITYSGASREKDSDGDLLSDEMEAQYGTDPKNPDTDGDGFKDGAEVDTGFNPNGEGKIK